MKISFFDDEPEIYPLQYGGKARTITNLAKEFAKLKEIESVKILSRSIKSEKSFKIDNVEYIPLNDENTIYKIAREAQETDILNIHCCSFTFPNIECKAKKIYFLHDVLIATADKGSHLDKSLGGNFDAILAPSKFAKAVYDKNRKILNSKTECFVIPRNINEELFYYIKKQNIKKEKNAPAIVKKLSERYEHVIFFPNRPIEEKGGLYLKNISDELNHIMNNYCIIGPFEKKDLPANFINTGWINSWNLKYYYSIADVTLNFSILPESFSQICIESIACGTPVVAFESGNISELGKLTPNIILVKKNKESIIDGIRKAVELKQDRNKIIEAQEIVRENFGTKKIINKYLKLYRSFLKE